jgi:hypothetical protein
MKKVLTNTLHLDTIREGNLMKTFEERIANKVDEAQSRFDSEIVRLADEVREKVIIPICKRRGWTFTTGMGVYGFYDKNGDVVYLDDGFYHGTRPIPKDLKRSLDICRIVAGQHELGLYIEDYK